MLIVYEQSLLHPDLVVSFVKQKHLLVNEKKLGCSKTEKKYVNQTRHCPSVLTQSYSLFLTFCH